LRYFEHRAILDAPDARPVIIELSGQPRHRAANRLKRFQHQACVVLENPVGVVALLRHGPRVAHDDHGQTLLNRFTQAARARLADEEIRELHEEADLRGKTDHRPGRARTRGAQLIGQFGIMAADENQLDVVESPCDPAHRRRSMASEHDDAGRPVRIKLQFAHFDSPIDARASVEIRSYDHSGSPMDSCIVVTRSAGLRDGLLRAANQVLRLQRFDPKMRRRIGEVREDGDIRDPWPCGGQCLIHGAVEIRHQRNDEIRLGSLPITRQLRGE